MNLFTPSEAETLATLTSREIGLKTIGRKLLLTNGWGEGVVVGAWRSKGKIHLLLAWPNADNPDQLFDEELEELILTEEKLICLLKADGKIT